MQLNNQEKLRKSIYQSQTLYAHRNSILCQLIGMLLRSQQRSLLRLTLRFGLNKKLLSRTHMVSLDACSRQLIMDLVRRSMLKYSLMFGPESYANIKKNLSTTIPRLDNSWILISRKTMFNSPGRAIAVVFLKWWNVP